MTAVFFDELKAELSKGISSKGHPFRYTTLATVGLEQVARLRTVVLRKIDDNLKMTFYTDKRSRKITHIQENPKVSFLFYHPKKLLQIRIEGMAKVITDEATVKKYWNGIQPNSKKDYTTCDYPGSIITNPDAVTYLEDNNYFCIVDVEPLEIEYLKLKRPNHLRVRYSKVEKGWESTFLVP